MSKALYSIISHGDVIKRSFIYEDSTSPSEKYEVVFQCVSSKSWSATDDKPEANMRTGDLKFAFNSAIAHVMSNEHIGEIYNVHPSDTKTS